MLEPFLYAFLGFAIGLIFFWAMIAFLTLIKRLLFDRLRIDNGNGELTNDCDDWAPFPCVQPAGSSVPDPGEGWRLAWSTEWEDERCEHWNCDKELWQPRKNVGMLFDIGGYYRIPKANPTPKRPDIEQQVCQDILDRQKIGIPKYGGTVAQSNEPLRAWLVHSYQEKLDDVIYMKRAIAAIEEQMNGLAERHQDLVEAATSVVCKSMFGGQHFVTCLVGDSDQAKELRHAIADLADALKEVGK